MWLSDTSVQRPVFAAVISLLLIILGLLALERLPVREYPDVNPTVVSVDTFYRGASAEVVERQITQILEDEVAGIAGVQKLTSSSQDERATITLEFALDRDPDGAANDVRERVSRAVSKLPDEADPPQITKQDSNMDSTMYVNVSSSSRSIMEITDFVRRYLEDKLSVVDGVAMVRMTGTRQYAMRIWLDREALAARRLTVQDVEAALRNENVEIPSGRIESQQREFTLRTDTGMKTAADFASLVIGRSQDNRVVRLGEVAEVRLDAEDDRYVSRSDGVPGISLGIVPQSKANVLAVNQGVIDEVERLKATLPDDIHVDVNVDFSIFIREQLKEVLETLAVALGMVLVVIFAFLGSLRATLIPAVTIPVAIIASFIVMAIMGYSVNTLTLLGTVLAIGLVVDDAIVVLENIVRRMELGQPPLLAAIDGSREIGFAVVATTAVLVAVFVPISFMPGNVGRLFTEFGITLAAAIAFSGLVSLTLVPMMASKMFAAGIRRRRLADGIDRFFKQVSARYRRALEPVVRRPWIAIAALVGTAVVGALLFLRLPSEYAPTEDRGMVVMMLRGPEGATPNYMDRQLRLVERTLAPYVEAGIAKRVVSRTGMWGAGGDVSSGFIYMPLNDWSKRSVSSPQIAQELRRKFDRIPGVTVQVFLPPSLGVRGGGQPLQVVLGGTSYEELVQWRDKVMDRVRRENPRIVGLRSDFFEQKPKIRVSVDRERASDLGVSVTAVGRTLETMLGSRIVTTFVDRGEEYNVVLQARPEDRASPSDLGDIYARSAASGQLIPLASLVTLEETAGPREFKRFNRLRAITLIGGLAPGYSLGDALKYMDSIIAEELPPEARVDYDGESREFKSTGNAIYFTFLLALVICFLVLSAQFESFRHPLIIMLTVPMAIAGGLFGLWLTGSSINVYSQIGAVMLIGLAAKNGILIVEFANQLRDRGVEFTEAIISSAAIRLRPVVMTSLCTAFGAMPLLLARGAGAEARQTLGAEVFFGVLVSVFLTLFLIPAVYALLARQTQSPEHIARQVEELKKAAGNTA
ncbi:Efflux pump membrane transporter BepE [Gammaproteobacteria bacterium]|nr:efflux RND transporter permease subunit [Gammaproteobacteria bacterium]QOJ30663.1 MAG: efflux RND transporter permease subunit [Gammaproteobacteria bacterium]CAG0941030.1 Efflux pump membrane transporter BepE [Gammaproteobacteria bacterium]